MWTGPGFVDHHTHVLGMAAGEVDHAEGLDRGESQRRLKAAGLSPTDRSFEYTSDDLEVSFNHALAEAASFGLVSITEAAVWNLDYIDALSRMRDKDIFPVRVRLLIASGLADPKQMSRLNDEFLDIIGVKFYSDGWLSLRTCALSEPFANEPDNDGILFLDRDEMCRRMAPFAEEGWVLATHAIGDRAIATVLDAYEAIFGSDCAVAEPRIEHAQVLTPELAARIAHLGVVVCIQPSFGVEDAGKASEFLGSKRASNAYNWQLLIDAGAKVITGSDFPHGSPEPLTGLQHLVTGAAIDSGDVVTHKLALDDALRIMTDATAGTVILSDDPHSVDSTQLSQLKVLTG